MALAPSGRQGSGQRKGRNPGREEIRDLLDQRLRLDSRLDLQPFKVVLLIRRMLVNDEQIVVSLCGLAQASDYKRSIELPQDVHLSKVVFRYHTREGSFCLPRIRGNF